MINRWGLLLLFLRFIQIVFLAMVVRFQSRVTAYTHNTHLLLHRNIVYLFRHIFDCTYGAGDRNRTCNLLITSQLRCLLRHTSILTSLFYKNHTGKDLHLT